jgi:UDP-glucose 4-epimerase
LRRSGHEVLIYDNLSTGHEILAEGFELLRGDVGDAATVTAALRRVDSVMHFAAHAYVGESVENPRKYFRNNVESGLVLLECVRGLRRAPDHFLFDVRSVWRSGDRANCRANSAPTGESLRLVEAFFRICA